MAAAKTTQVQQVVRDPGIEIDGMRVLQRTDGVWILYSDKLPPGKRTVHGRLFDSERAASEYARTVKSVFMAPAQKATPPAAATTEGARRGASHPSLAGNQPQGKGKVG